MTRLKHHAAAAGRPWRDGVATPAPRPSRWHRWMWLPVLVVGTLLFLADQMAVVATGNPTLIPSLLLFEALLIPVTFVVWVDGRNPAYDLPFGVLLLCGLLGGAVGTGFAVLENLGYGFVILVATGGDLAAAEGTLLARGLLSPAAHIAWTGLAAAALWHAYARRWRPRATAATVGTFVLVVILHTIWDTVPGWPTFAVVGGISFALLIRQTRRDVLVAAPGRAVGAADSGEGPAADEEARP